MKKIPYIKRVSKLTAHWKSTSSCGDPTKVYVREIIFSPKRKDKLKRAFLVTQITLTAMPEKYTRQAHVVRLFKGRALIAQEEIHTAETWLMIGRAVEKLLAANER